MKSKLVLFNLQAELTNSINLDVLAQT